MKTTRRIEITRYRRRLTVFHGGVDGPVSADALSTIEIVTGDRELIPGGQQELNSDGFGEVAAAAIGKSRRGLARNLRDWLRLRF